MRLRSAGSTPPSPSSASLLHPATSPTPLPTPRLPLELLALIVQEAISSLVEDSESRIAAELCLVSKFLLPFAQNAFYFDVTFHGKGWSDDSDELFPGDKLLRTLQQALHLARRVHVLSTPQEREYTSLAVEQHIREARRLCPNAHTLSAVSCRCWPTPTENLLTVAKGFRRVELGMISSEGPFDRVLLPLADMPGLQELDFLQCSLREPLPPPPQLHLTSFVVEDVHDASLPLDKLLDYFLSHSTASLRHLGLLGRHPLPSLARFTALTSLEIVLGPSGGCTPAGRRLPIRPSPTSDMLDSILATCASCHLLRRLHLFASDHGKQAVALIESTGFLTRLAPTLDTLDLSLLSVSLSALLDFLADDISPSLRRLNVRRLEDLTEQVVLQ